MAEHPHAALIRRAIAALNAGDDGYLDSIMVDDVVWHTTGASEPIRGKEALRSMGSDSRGYEFIATLRDVTASDDHAVALIRSHVVREGRSLDFDTAEIFHIVDGMITERWAFSDDTARIAEFFA
ncbi:MAG: nuclear transport factor 2 family protein [Acidimicrobiia bacterium]